MRIGAATRNMNRVNMPQMRFPDWPHVEPSPGLVAAGAKLVTRKGELIKTQLGESVLMPGFENRWEDIFIVIDKATAAKLATAKDDGDMRDGWYKTGKPFIGTAPGVGYAYLEDCKDWSWYRRAATVEAAARHIGAAPARLKAALGKGAEGPFHVLGPVLRVIANSGGGLSTDFKLNVVAEADGKPIKGLYGGGVNARLISFLGGHGYALAWAMASGRIAGENAAKYAVTSSKRR
jgi:succinate dehydrogenase/fumarate reductase flavoprotein subunit